MCEKLRKVPIDERAFIADLRGKRQMKIGGIDKKTSKRLQVQKKRKLLEVTRCENRKKAKNAAEDTDHAEEDDSSDST